MKTILKQKDIPKIAKAVIKKVTANKLNVGTVLALSGELGAGKTTLTQEIAKIFKVKEKVISPTFVIMKIYKIKYKNFKNLIHIDAYRLKNGEELRHLGWDELIKNKDNFVVLEWPERVYDCLDENTFRIYIAHQDENTRVLEY